jgi:Concanavalin A-like lectin/glucanases superfamily/Secretion system C-terminal sorting domain
MRNFILIAIAFLALISAKSQTVDSGLVAYFPFDSSVDDHSIYGSADSVIGSFTYTADEAGVANKAVLFDGSSCLIVPASALLNVTNHLTISFRFYSFISGGSYIVSKADWEDGGTINNVQYQVGFNFPYTMYGDGLFWGTKNNATCLTTTYNPGDYIFSGTSVAAYYWYNVVMTFDSGFKAIYINDTLVDTGSVGTTYANPYAIDSCEGGSLHIGAWWNEDPDFFHGIMDDLRIYNRKLSDSEIHVLCSARIDSTTSMVTTGLGKTFGASPEIKLMPNPATTAIAIASNNRSSATYDISIHDFLGRLVKNVTVSAQEQIDIQDLAPGIYMATISTENGRVTAKFVKD